MNARALVLAAVAVAIAAVLYVIASGDDRGGGTEDVDDRRTKVVDDSLSVVETASGLREVSELLAGDWTVVVEGPDGAPIADAAVQIGRGDEVHVDLSPECTFSDLETGAWELHVVADGLPEWHSTIELRSGRRMRTVVTLTSEVQITGVVLDERGDPVARTPIWLLPEGVEHPPGSGHVFGLPGASTGRDGSFRLRAPEGGTFRLSLGEAGPVARRTSEPFELLAIPGPSARWVVPALVRLTVAVEGLEDREVVHVAVLTDEEASTGANGDVVARDDALGGAAAVGPRPTPATPEGDVSQDGDAAGGGATSGAATAPMSAEGRRHIEDERARMASARKLDGRSLRQLRVEADRTVVTEGLPSGGILRFRLQRGPELLVVSTIFQPRQGDDARLTVVAPAPLPFGSPLPAERRACAGRIESVEPARDPLRVGLVID